MNDYIYNPVGYKYLETEEGKEELQKEINKFKSISNKNFKLTEDDYIDLACLSIVSRANFKEQTYQLLNKKLQIAQTLIIFAKALINNSTLTCSVSIKGCPQGERIKRDILHKSEIDNQELILDNYSTYLMFFRENCKYEIGIALYTMGKRVLFPPECTSTNKTNRYINSSKKISNEEYKAFIALAPYKKPDALAVNVLERIKAYLEQEIKHSKFTSTPLAILAPIIYQIIARNNSIDISTKPCVFIYDIIVQIGYAQEIEDEKGKNRQKRDLIKRYLEAKTS